MIKRKTPHSEFKEGSVFLANIRLPPGERKDVVAFRIKRKYIDEITKIKGYNNIVERLIEDYLKKNKD